MRLSRLVIGWSHNPSKFSALSESKVAFCDCAEHVLFYLSFINIVILLTPTEISTPVSKKLPATLVVTSQKSRFRCDPTQQLEHHKCLMKAKYHCAVTLNHFCIPLVIYQNVI